MSATVVMICNAALSRIGELGTVTDIYPPEGSAEAEYCAHYYPVALRSLLSARNWGFARRVQGLSRLAEENPRWLYVYAFPADCLVLRALRDGAGAEVVHEVLYNGTRTVIGSDEATPVAEYTAYNQDPVQFPFLFVDALTWKLAALLAGSVIKGLDGMKMGMQCEQYAAALMQKAMEDDANQARHEVVHRVDWLEGR